MSSFPNFTLHLKKKNIAQKQFQFSLYLHVATDLRPQHSYKNASVAIEAMYVQIHFQHLYYFYSLVRQYIKSTAAAWQTRTDFPLTHPGLESLNAEKVFLIIAWKTDVYTIIQNTNTIIDTCALLHTDTHTHCTPIEAALIVLLRSLLHLTFLLLLSLLKKHVLMEMIFKRTLNP